jgi:hypothetical protein
VLVDALQVLLRLVHVGLGALWVGMMSFTVFFLGPALQETGPEGGKVMGAIQRRGLMTVMPLIAIATILSGLWLYWRAAGGLAADYARSRMGLAYGAGGAAAIIGYLLGILVVRPTMLRMGDLGPRMAAAAPQDRQALGEEMQRLRARSATASRLVAALLLFALAAMAVARYL